MDIFIEATPGNNSVPAIRVRNDLVAISLPVSTTPASSISGLTPQVISGRTSRITTGSTKSAKISKSTKSLNVIIHFPSDQVKGATDWYFQEMKKKMYVELRMKKKSEIYRACIDQNIALHCCRIFVAAPKRRRPLRHISILTHYGDIQG